MKGKGPQMHKCFKESICQWAEILDIGNNKGDSDDDDDNNK